MKETDKVIKDSILASVKLGIGGIDPDNEDFDNELIMDINTVLRELVQMGIGKESFVLEKDIDNWDDFLPESQQIMTDVKTFVILKTKLIFDPPTSSIKLQAINQIIDETTYRLHIAECVD